MLALKLGTHDLTHSIAQINRQFIEHRLSCHYLARPRYCSDTRGDVNRVAEYIIGFFDYRTKVKADANVQRHAIQGLNIFHRLPDRTSGMKCGFGARESGHDLVAYGFYQRTLASKNLVAHGVDTLED